jgi:chromate transporter
VNARPDQVFFVSLWLGLVSFGGGLAIVPEMHRQLVDTTGWITPREFADGYALAQLSPGPNMLCIAFYGFKASGWFAGLLAPLAIVVPGVTLSAVCGRAWERLARSVWVVRLRRGVVPVGLGLMAGGVFVVGRTTIVDAPMLAIAGVVAIVVTKKWVHPAIAVLGAGVIGVLLQR